MTTILQIRDKAEELNTLRDRRNKGVRSNPLTTDDNERPLAIQTPATSLDLEAKSRRPPLKPVTIIGADGNLYRDGEKVGQLDTVRPYREKILDHFANEMSAQDLRDWAEEFELRAKEK